MASSVQTGSADIIPFPAGGRAALRERSWAGIKLEERVTATPRVVFDGWYHDDAIRDDDNQRGH